MPVLNTKKYKEYTGQVYSYLDDIPSTPLLQGVVENSCDPLCLGRVQVRVPSLHKIENTDESYIDDFDLPWARPGSFNCAGNDYGQFLPPIAGTRVWVMFEDGDPDKPVYFGGIPTAIGNTKLYNKNNPRVLGGEFDVTTDDTPSEIQDSNNTTGIIYKSIKGATIIIDDTDYEESMTLIDQSGQKILMSNYGNNKLGRRGGVENYNCDSFIEITHDNYIKTIMDCSGISLIYKKKPDPIEVDPSKPLDMDGIDDTPECSVKVSSDGISLTTSDNMDIMINGKYLEQYIYEVIAKVLNLDKYPNGTILNHKTWASTIMDSVESDEDYEFNHVENFSNEDSSE